METSTVKIAIADDHVMMRDSISSAISLFPGFNVIIEADNGKELIDKLKHAQQPADICILDIGMPVMNGYETQKYIKEKYPDIKSLVLTMYNNEFSIIKMLKMGANGYLQKAAPLKELEKALLCIYEKGFYNSELISGHLYNAVHDKTGHIVPKITDKELVFLEYCCTELNYKQIAAKMALSVRTIHGYRDSLFDKLNLRTRMGLVMYAIEIGLVSIDHTKG